MPSGKPRLYELTIDGNTRTAPLRFGEATRVLAAYYEEGLTDVAAFIDGRPAELPEAMRLVHAARKLVAAETG